jgi:quercetin dioxygenase-like cupin family protein
VYVVLAGSGRAKLDGETHELRQWDALRVPPQVARGFAAGPDGMELLVIGFGDGGDAETIAGYWDES